MKKVLVTGSNGFIGSHLVPLLLVKGYDVHCLVRYTSDISGLRNLNVTMHVGDVRDPASLKIPVSNASYIFHLAAKLLVTTEEEFNETNVGGAKNILEAAELYAKNTLERLVLVSSLAAAGPNKELIPHNETAELNPISWYGSSKKQVEALGRSYFGKLPITIVRPSVVYGEREQDLSQVYPMVENRIQPKLGIWRKALVAVYVGDLVKGMVAASESQQAIGQAYFLNHPEILSSGDIVKNIGIAMGKPSGLVLGTPNIIIKAFAPVSELIYEFNSLRPKMTRDKALEVSQRYWIADPSKAKRDFGWSAEFNTIEGMKKSLVPYFEQKKILRDMALENNFILWLKYFLVALALGVVVETVSYLGRFYAFHPWWMILVIIVGAFGLLFGSLAKILRRQSTIIQFIIGALSAGLVEVINLLGLIPGYYWVFADGWPLGITNPWLRTVVLALPGGIFILILNFIMRSIYKTRLTRRGDRPLIH